MRRDVPPVLPVYVSDQSLVECFIHYASRALPALGHAVAIVAVEQNILPADPPNSQRLFNLAILEEIARGCSRMRPLSSLLLGPPTGLPAPRSTNISQGWYNSAVFCPLCKADYRDGFDKCSDCSVGLVSTLEEAQAAKVVLLWEGTSQSKFREIVAALQDANVPNLARSGATAEHIGIANI